MGSVERRFDELASHIELLGRQRNLPDGIHLLQLKVPNVRWILQQPGDQSSWAIQHSIPPRASCQLQRW